MHILILDASAERRARLVDAIHWVGQPVIMHQAAALHDIEPLLPLIKFRLILVGPQLPEGTLTTLGFLREVTADACLVACDIAGQREIEDEHLAAGADLALSSSLSLWRVSLLLRNLLSDTPPPTPAYSPLCNQCSPA